MIGSTVILDPVRRISPHLVNIHTLSGKVNSCGQSEL